MTADKRINLSEYLSERKIMIDQALEACLPQDNSYPSVIFQAARYSVFAGGKRLRPILCLAAAEAAGGSVSATLPFACALELIHTYSLIHDDLPAMDDDDFRRGFPTNHKVYGEAVAILAGDALLTEAFSLMTGENLSADISPAVILRVIHEISRAAGFWGMIGGQVVDIASEGKEIDFATLHYIHTHKTEALITASLRAGALIAGAGDNDLKALTEYGNKIGLAFQIADDILDIEGEQDVIGKDAGSDVARGKATYPALCGIEASRAEALRLVQEALQALAGLGFKAEPLRLIAEYIVARKS